MRSKTGCQPNVGSDSAQKTDSLLILNERPAPLQRARGAARCAIPPCDAMAMAHHDFRMPRLYVEQPLERDARITLDRQQAHYLVNVLRLATGAAVLTFNGRDGEWRSGLDVEGRKRFALTVREQTRPQPPPGDLDYLFAPLKHARLDYMVQKAVEMGATRLRAVLSRHTQTQRVNLARMRANAIEAAEQCGILAIPTIVAPVGLDRVIAEWPSERLLVSDDSRRLLDGEFRQLLRTHPYWASCNP